LDFARSHTSVKLPEKPNELEIAKVFLAYSRVSNGFEDTPLLGLSESIKSGHYKACLLLGGRPIEGAADIKSKPRGAPGLVSGRLQKRNQTAQDFLAWGITIANFARSQVLYRLDAKDLGPTNCGL
jgi:hypothetical protein